MGTSVVCAPVLVSSHLFGAGGLRQIPISFVPCYDEHHIVRHVSLVKFEGSRRCCILVEVINASAGLTMVGSDAVLCQLVKHWRMVIPCCSMMHSLRAMLTST